MTKRDDLLQSALQITSNHRNVMPEVKISNYLFFRQNNISYFCGQYIDNSIKRKSIGLI